MCPCRNRALFNPNCSKCRTAEDLLKEAGVEAELVPYLDRAPTIEELRDLMQLLGIDDPRAMMSTGEEEYKGLETASPDDLLAAIAKHPILLERPMFVRNGRAVIARPPDRVLELLA